MGDDAYDLGEPDALFYWGPSRAEPFYMSDFMAAVERFFVRLAADPALPMPPRTLVLFQEGRMVWLSNAREFAAYVDAMFDNYAFQGRLDDDIAAWRKAAWRRHSPGREFDRTLLQAWGHTLSAEFSLYGAEAAVAERLRRFDAGSRQAVWTAFTIPDEATFLGRIDSELQQSRDPLSLAAQYPWIQDGYGGTSDAAQVYFEKRLADLRDGPTIAQRPADRTQLARKYGLCQEELAILDLVRGLAGFMDERKAWMMRTRRLLRRPLTDIRYGWSFSNGVTARLPEQTVHELWHRYIRFRTASPTVRGIVASNGGRRFIGGKVVVIDSPVASIARDRILVVPSTSPSYVPLMRTARALITDHGGMMSHAAIVAREFNLPCIVGTQHGTRTLHDGDRVVLGLTHGEVIR